MKTLLAIACVLVLANGAEAQTRKRSSKSETNTSESQEKQDAKKASKPGDAEKAKSTAKKTDDVDKPTPKSASVKSDASKAGASTSKKGSNTPKTGSAEQVASTLKRSTAIPPDKKKSAAPVSVGSKTEDQQSASKTDSRSKKSESSTRYDAGDEIPGKNSGQFGPNITLDPEDLADFEKQPTAVQRLLRLGLELTHLDLTYRYGSAEPSTGGMDCSGTIYYLLKSAGIKEPPRDSTGLYLWAEREGTLHRVSPLTLKDPVMDDLRPGDLLFWEGTYNVLRNPPISHTMIYLGREKKTGFPVMVGASDGRTYAGVRRNGVSVFDFKLPRTGSSARFVGYARVPGLK